MMDLTENMFRYVAQEVCGTTVIPYAEETIDLGKPFERLTMVDAVKKYAGVDFDQIPDTAAAKKLADEKGVHYEERHAKGDILNLFFEEFVEEHLIQPVFIMDHPVEISPLTKRKPDKPDYVERFELFIYGREMCNAYSELNDPLDQEERFKEQMRLADKGDDEAMIIDQDFLRSLQYGMPPTSGIGIGIDRLVMLMTGQTTIQEVLFFPQMRPEKVIKKDPATKYMELGIAEDWVPVIQKAGYNTVADMQDVNPQKLHQDICGINKKYKLELTNPSVNDVTEWINKLK